MRVHRFATEGFRNLRPAVWSVEAPLVVWWGANGQGKTNLLEAVGVLGALRSFRTARVAEVVAAGAQRAAVEAVVTSEAMTRRHRWSHGLDGRRIEREERAVEAQAWLQGLRATWFAPEDVLLVRGEPALRRALLDRTVLTVDPAYLPAARLFRRLLDQKAAALRENAGDALLDVLDDQLAGAGTDVSRRRAAVVEGIQAAWREVYRALAGSEVAEVTLRSWLGEGSEATYRQRLGDQRVAERQARRNLGGAQRDDVVFRVGGLPARTSGSQGQARSLVLAWKLCELQAARQRHGESPLFLMDDLGSELDARRTASLMAVLRSAEAQVFVTTTDLRYIPDLGEEALVYEVREGGAVD